MKNPNKRHDSTRIVPIYEGSPLSYAQNALQFGGLSGSKSLDSKSRKFYEIRQSSVEGNDIIFTLPDEQKVKMPATDGYGRIYGDFTRISDSFQNSLSFIDTDLDEVKSHVILSGGILKIP